jgi:hypothetical protein
MRSILHARSSRNHPKIFASAMRHERSDLSPQRLIRPHRLVQFASKRVLVVISYGKMISNVGLRNGVGRYPGLHLAASLRPRGLPLNECENATCRVGIGGACLLYERLVLILRSEVVIEFAGLVGRERRGRGGRSSRRDVEFITDV